MNWVGACAVVLASYYCGVLLAKADGGRLRCVESLIGLMGYMRRRMAGERQPLYRIFSEYSDEYLDESGFLRAVASRNADVSELWIACLPMLDLDEREREELSLFGESLGKLPLDEQIKRLDICISALASSRESLKSTLPAKQKSTRTVCLLFGLLTAIILL